MKNLKHFFLGGLVFSGTIILSLVGFAYTTLPNQNTNDTLTSTIWNNLIDRVNLLGTDLDSVKSTYSQLGVGQTRQDVTASRVVGTTYTNNTGKPIVIVVRGAGSYVGLAGWNCIINGVSVPLAISGNTLGADNVSGSVIVPVGATYKVDLAGVGSRMGTWVELR